METKYVRSTYEENLLTTNSKHAQNSTALGLINHMLAKPRTNLATEAIYKSGATPNVAGHKTNRSKDFPHYDSNPSSPGQRRHPVITTKKLKSSLYAGASLENLDKENTLKPSLNRANFVAAPTGNYNTDLRDFRKPESPRLCRIHRLGRADREAESGEGKLPLPVDAGVNMGTRSNVGHKSQDGQKGARLRSKSSSRVLDAGSDSGRSFSLGIFGTGSSSRASAGKSAVEMLEASKSLYVKSAQVRERKQEPSFSGVLQVTSLSTDPALLVSMTRDGAAHAGREGDDLGAMSDGGVIEGVVSSSARSAKPASLSFAPTPILVHHSALRLKDIQASSSGELLDATASPTSSSSSSSRDNLLGETPSTGDDVLDRFCRSPITRDAAVAHTAVPSHPSALSQAGPPPRPYRPGNNAATKLRTRSNAKSVPSSASNCNEASIQQTESETLHTSAKKLSIVSDASTTSDEEPWKREGHHAKKPRHTGIEAPSSDLSCPTESDVDRSIQCRTSTSVATRPTANPCLRPILSKKRIQSYSLDEPGNAAEKGREDGDEVGRTAVSANPASGIGASLYTAFANDPFRNRLTSTIEAPTGNCLLPSSRASPTPFRSACGDAKNATGKDLSSAIGVREASIGGASPGRVAHGVQRSKSDAGGKAGAASQLPSLLQQKHSPDLDRFFDSMGIDQSVLLSTSDSVDWDALGGGVAGGSGAGNLDGPGSAKAHGDSGSSLDSFPRTGSEHIRSTGSDFGDDEDGDGAGYGRGGGRGPLAGRNSRDVSVIERNARVIKWLCNVSKAKERAITQ